MKHDASTCGEHLELKRWTKLEREADESYTCKDCGAELDHASDADIVAAALPALFQFWQPVDAIRLRVRGAGLRASRAHIKLVMHLLEKLGIAVKWRKFPVYEAIGWDDPQDVELSNLTEHDPKLLMLYYIATCPPEMKLQDWMHSSEAFQDLQQNGFPEWLFANGRPTFTSMSQFVALLDARKDKVKQEETRSK